MQNGQRLAEHNGNRSAPPETFSDAARFRDEARDAAAHENVAEVMQIEIQMNDATNTHAGAQFSLRRTVLTLLGAMGAFAVMIASYATAELPANAATQPGIETVSTR